MGSRSRPRLVGAVSMVDRSAIIGKLAVTGPSVNIVDAISDDN
jgi:hypothetical protein